MLRSPVKPGILGSLLVVALLAGCNSAGAPYGYANGGALPLPAEADAEVRGTTAAPAARCIANASHDALVQQALSLVNIERARIGVSPLTLNDELTVAAEDYACLMAVEDFFDHTDPVTGDGPGERAAAAGYLFFAVGENLAAGQRTAAEVVEAWMDSPEHRDNLLSPEWKETGIGVRGGGLHGVYWVQEFGRPASIRHEAVIIDGALTVIRG